MSRDMHRPVTIRRPVPSRENYGALSRAARARQGRPGVRVVLCQAPPGTRQIGVAGRVSRRRTDWAQAVQLHGSVAFP